jgi:murein DD-endopeptidase MepM/ murein hydrolase activator NlpD
MFVKMTSFLAAATMLMASPALADETTPEGMIDATTAVSGGIDTEFSELFASWESLETGSHITATAEIHAAPRIGVSIPSRMPVDGVTLTSGFGMRNHPILNRRARHNGVDLAAPRGTPVYATADGMVQMAQWYSSYGNYVQIGHGTDMETRYAHLSSYTVSPGQDVRAGDLIGYVGSTGRSTGPHLHYEVRVANEPVNPIPYMVAQLDASDADYAARGGPDEE